MRCGKSAVEQLVSRYTTKNEFGSYLRLPCVDCHELIIGNFWYFWLVCLVSEQNVAMQVGVYSYPAAESQRPSHVCRFKMLNSLDMIRVES